MRVHVIILTRNRTNLLERSVNAAIKSLQCCDVLTVLDDSGNATIRRNAGVLEAMARRSSAMITHVAPPEVYKELDKVTEEHPPQIWRYRTGPRDIAPLRNIALVLAAALGARTNVFVDDDMSGFDIEETHRYVEARRAARPSVIVGAEVIGRSEMDTVTKLEEVARRIGLSSCRGTSLEELLAVRGTDHPWPAECGWVSAGYMAFSLDPSQYFAFPPGYNEDWLWCLLHGMSGNVRIVRSPQRVCHMPASTRRPTGGEDLWFELKGDLVFDCLRSLWTDEERTPLETFTALESQRPETEVLPSTRVRETLEEIAKLRMNRRRGSVFEKCGLGVMRRLGEDGGLERAEEAVLGDWCAEARAKHRAYASLLADRTALGVVVAMAAERRI